MSANGEDKKPAAADGVHINLKVETQMSHEGYHVDADHIQPKRINPLCSSGDQPNNNNNASGILSPNSDIPETVLGQPSNEVAKLSDSGTNNRSIMLELGNVGMGGNTGNNMVGIQGTGNVMEMGGDRGISPPMAGAISGMGNSMGQNAIDMNQASNINVISQQLRSGMITPAQAAIMATKLRMAQSRNILGGAGGQSGNMVGIQGMGNVMEMGGNHGVSSPMAGAISGMGNSIGQNPISMDQASSISNVISQQLRSGMITPAQAAIMTTKLRMAQSRNILGGAGGQSGNNMVGIQGMGNVMEMGGNHGVSSPMAGAISGMENSMEQNPISMDQASNISNVISQQLRSGMITPAQAAIMTTKLRMAQSRNILGGAGGQSGNNMVGIQGMGNVMEMGGNHGVSSPMAGAISGMENSMEQNPISMDQASIISNVISQQLRSGMITPAQAAIMTTKLRMAQSRNILGGAGGQSGNITGLAGANEKSEDISKP